MAIAERETLALEGVIVVAVDVIRPKAAMSSGGGWAGAAGGAANAAGGLSCKARLTTRAMWTDQGKLLDTLHQVGVQAKRGRRFGGYRASPSGLAGMVGCVKAHEVTSLSHTPPS
jgi:hypothetical protein